MSMTLEQIEAEALKLTPEERELLAESLFASLDSAQAAIDQEGLAEARRRDHELRSGAVRGESLAEVVAYLNAPAK